MPHSFNERYQTVVLTINGRFLGSKEGDAMSTTLSQSLERGHTNLVIDLSKTEFMDSSGIGTLLSLRERVVAAGGNACLAGMQKRLKSVFLMTKLLGPVFTNYDSVDEAAQSLAHAQE